MAITTLPTRDASSIGATKVDLHVAPNTTNHRPAAEINRLLDRVVEAFGEIGLSDGSTVGSINAKLVASGPVKNTISAVADPGVNDDSTAGYSRLSLWAHVYAGDGGSGASTTVWICAHAGAGAARWINLSALVATTDARLGPTYIPTPSAAVNANATAAGLAGNPVAEWAPTAARKFDPRDATTSMALTFWKSNSAAFGITIDVTTGGNQGWTTDGGLNTDFLIVGSDSAAPGQWLIRIDLVSKRINVLPVG